MASTSIVTSTGFSLAAAKGYSSTVSQARADVSAAYNAFKAIITGTDATNVAVGLYQKFVVEAKKTKAEIPIGQTAGMPIRSADGAVIVLIIVRGGVSTAIADAVRPDLTAAPPRFTLGLFQATISIYLAGQLSKKVALPNLAPAPLGARIICNEADYAGKRFDLHWHSGIGHVANLKAHGPAGLEFLPPIGAITMAAVLMDQSSGSNRVDTVRTVASGSGLDEAGLMHGLVKANWSLADGGKRTTRIAQMIHQACRGTATSGTIFEI